MFVMVSGIVNSATEMPAARVSTYSILVNVLKTPSLLAPFSTHRTFTEYYPYTFTQYQS